MPDDNKPCPICEHQKLTVHASLLIIHCHGCHIRFDFKSIASSLGSMLAVWDKLPRRSKEKTCDPS